jgi:hypothetical protein
MPLAGSRLFQAGDVLTAEQVQSFLMDQSIMGFEDTSARDAAFGGFGEATLARGMFAYTADTNTLWLYDSINWVPAINNASLNGVGQSVAYTPTFTNLTVGNGTVDFRFARVQNFVYVQGTIQFGSTTSVSGGVSATLPVTSTTRLISTPIGTVSLLDSGAARYFGPALHAGTTAFVVNAFTIIGTSVSTQAITATTPFTWGTGDVISVQLVYEAS